MISFRIHLIIWFCILSCVFAKAQDKVAIDSLQIVIDTTNNDSIRLEALLDLGEEFITYDFERTVQVANQVIGLSRKRGEKKIQALAYNLLGRAYEDKNLSFDTTITAFNKAIDLAEEIRDTSFLSTLLNNKALTRQRFAQYTLALELYQEGLNLAKDSKDTLSAIRCLNNMAIIFKDKYDYDNALELYQEALQLSKEVGKKTYEASLLNNIGIVYGLQAKLDSALVNYAQSLELKRTFNNPRSLVTTLGNIGSIYAEKEQYERAEQYLKEAYEIADNENYIFGKGFVLTEYAIFYYRQENYASAIQKSEEGIQVIDTFSYFSLQETFFEILKESYSKTQNYKAAFHAQRLYHKALDTLQQAQLNDTIKSVAIQLTLEREQAEKEAILQREKAAQLTIRNRNFIVVFISLISLVLLGWGISTYRSFQQRKNYSEELEKTVAERTEELQKANAELQSFNYVASHDIKEPIRNIGTYATIIEKKLPDEHKQALNTYFETIQKSSIRLHNLIEDIARYSSLSKEKDISFEKVNIQNLTKDVERGILSTLEEKNGSLHYASLPKIKTSSSILYLIFKNLIENGLKFNNSTDPQVHIDYFELEEEHQFIFSDNGIGVSESHHQRIFEMFKRLNNKQDYKGSGMGLAIVKMMVDKIDGSITVESIKDEGSRFILTFPKIRD
jgi:signal transduction histidine kinase